MKTMFVRPLAAVVFLIAALLASNVVRAGDGPGGFPGRAINFLCPWGAGGGSDVGARILAAVAEKYIGAPLVVQNRPGAGGAIGWAALAASRPDGYTISLNNIPAMVLVPLMNRVDYDFADFEPIMLLVDDPALLMVKKDGIFNDFKEFVEYAKANPGILTVGTSGAGTDSHIVVEMINDMLGIKLNPIPFDGANQSVTSMLGGHTLASLPKTSEAIAALESGQGLLLGVFNDTRLPQYPDLPTMKEMGLDISYSSARGLMAPKGTPPEIVEFLRDRLQKATEDPEYIERMNNAGLPIAYMNGKDFKDYYMKQYEAFKPVVERLGLGPK
ncbi:MAG: tripartite tricarboxylate transporter substrate binding protein [Planctomycetes bacterium]|nr:tripartite tricarboxylate transporter substrate binding protein [Planctomycetota bacterium]